MIEQFIKGACDELDLDESSLSEKGRAFLKQAFEALPTPPPRKKTNYLPWIVGGLGLGAAGLGMYGASKYLNAPKAPPLTGEQVYSSTHPSIEQQAPAHFDALEARQGALELAPAAKQFAASPEIREYAPFELFPQQVGVTKDMMLDRPSASPHWAENFIGSPTMSQRVADARFGPGVKAQLAAAGLTGLNLAGMYGTLGGLVKRLAMGAPRLAPPIIAAAEKAAPGAVPPVIEAAKRSIPALLSRFGVGAAKVTAPMAPYVGGDFVNRTLQYRTGNTVGQQDAWADSTLPANATGWQSLKSRVGGLGALARTAYSGITGSVAHQINEGQQAGLGIQLAKQFTQATDPASIRAFWQNYAKASPELRQQVTWAVGKFHDVATAQGKPSALWDNYTTQLTALHTQR